MTSMRRDVGSRKHLWRNSEESQQPLWSEEGPLLQGDRIVICEHLGCCYDEERLDLSCFVPSARIRNDWCVLQESTF